MTLVFIPGAQGAGVIIMGIKNDGRPDNWGSPAHFETILKEHPAAMDVTTSKPIWFMSV